MRLSDLTEDREIEERLRSLHLHTIQLPQNTPLYHGTDRPDDNWDPSRDPIWPPVWLGLDIKIAWDYARFARSGEHGSPYVIEYETVDPITLLEASGEEIANLLDELYGNYTSDDIADAVCGMGLRSGWQGWHIKDSEVMICDTDLIRFVRILRPSD